MDANRRDRTGEIAAVLIGLGLVAGGLDVVMGGAIAALASAPLLIFMLLSKPLPRRFWQKTSLVFGCLAGAICWNAARVLGPEVLPGVFGPTARGFAPDLLLPALLGLWACIAALMIGAASGWRGTRTGQAQDAIIVMVAASAFAALAFRAFGGADQDIVWQVMRKDRFAGPFGNANVAGAVFAASAVLALGRALPTQSAKAGPIASAMRWTAALLLVGCTASTASRMANVLLVLAIGIQLFAIGGGMARWLRFGLIASGVAAVAAIGTAQLLLDRFSVLGEESVLRLTMWTHYFAIAMRRPFTGYGLGSFASVNVRFLDDPWIAQQVWMVNSPHGVFLRLLLEGGLAYAGLVTAAAVAIATAIIRHFRSTLPTASELGAACAAFVIIGCASVDIVLDIVVPATMLMFLVGLVWGRALAGLRPVGVADAQTVPRDGQREVSV